MSQTDDPKSTTLDKSEVKQEAPAEPSLDQSEVQPKPSLDKSQAKTLGPSEAQAKKDGKVRGWTQKGGCLWEPSPSSPDWGGSQSSASGSEAAPLDQRGEANKVARLGQIRPSSHRRLRWWPSTSTTPWKLMTGWMRTPFIP